MQPADQKKIFLETLLKQDWKHLVTKAMMSAAFSKITEKDFICTGIYCLSLSSLILEANHC